MDHPGHGWTVTEQGIRTALYLILRVETAATLALLLVFTTPWAHVLKALRDRSRPGGLRGHSGHDLPLYPAAARDCARNVRIPQEPHGRPGHAGDRRRLAVSSAGVLLSKTYRLSGEVYLAMQSRGFRGEVYVLDDFRMRARDWTALAAFTALAAAAAWAGR